MDTGYNSNGYFIFKILHNSYWLEKKKKILDTESLETKMQMLVPFVYQQRSCMLFLVALPACLVSQSNFFLKKQNSLK